MGRGRVFGMRRSWEEEGGGGYLRPPELTGGCLFSLSKPLELEAHDCKPREAIQQNIFLSKCALGF